MENIGGTAVDVKARRAGIVLLCIIVLGPLLAWAAFEAAWQGGIANVIRNLLPQPNPDDASIRSARAKLGEEIDALLTRIASTNGFTSYAAAKDDRCYSGQNNYKVTEGFAHRCTLRLTRFFGFDGDFRARVINVEKSLFDSGWKTGSLAYPVSDRTMEYVMAHYYDRRPGATVDRIATPDGYYRLATDKGPGLSLRIAWAERASSHLSSLEYIQRTGNYAFFRRSDLLSKTDVYQKVTAAHWYLLGVTIYGHYFEH